MSNFKAGDKVVCVDDSPGSTGPVPFSQGDVHCIREMHTDGDAVLLVGIYEPHPILGEYFFYSSRFRLVSEVKLIMSAVRKNAIGKEVETHTVAKP